ncbi:hypothetical protein C4M96_03850 [Mycoplasmopsis pullorum]|uniref:MAGa3780 family membrane protein n=1 Tax=Mycoplasmopsis pullorum TaxID=48003 RepID=UPI001117E6D5|nr:hypothetical protein [Mycoplasmopsis pullorum]TNK83067.1 hypothetical protein C4M93_02970 [Mycoplasmopsis pullorum]TNK91636.1 hypothetical protein C4M96_03850 [Mycoplasmopsis pullorum]
MKTNSLKISINKDKYPFFQWTKLRKATLFAGIAVLVLVMIVTIFYFFYERDLFAKRLAQIDDATLNQLYKNQLLPNMLARFWRRTLTFTWLSNLFLGIALILFAIYPRNWIAQRAIFLAVVYITITFFVFWGLIFPESIKRFQFLNFVMTSIVHFINPLIGFVFLILIRKNIKVTELTIWLSCITLLAYYFFALISYFVGDSMINDLSNRLGTSNNQDLKLHRELDLVIYGFLNFRSPLFLKPTKTYVSVIINIAIVVVGLLTPPLIGICWQKACRIKYDNVTKAYDVK